MLSIRSSDGNGTVATRLGLFMDYSWIWHQMMMMIIEARVLIARFILDILSDIALLLFVRVSNMRAGSADNRELDAYPRVMSTLCCNVRSKQRILLYSSS